MSHFWKICVSSTLINQKKTETNKKPAQMPAVAREPVASQYKNQLALPLPVSLPLSKRRFLGFSLVSHLLWEAGIFKFHSISFISLSYRFLSSLPSRDIDFLPWVSENALLPRHLYPACWLKHYSHFSRGHEDVTPAARGSRLLPLEASGLNFWQGPWETFEGKIFKSSDLWRYEDSHRCLLYLPQPYRWHLPWGSKFFLILWGLGMGSEGKL